MMHSPTNVKNGSYLIRKIY